MPRYLTNTDKSDVTEFMVYVAAIRSGQDVRYLNCPMPPDDYEGDTYYARTYAAGEFNGFACFACFDNSVTTDVGCSPFWKEFWKLEKGC